MVNTNGSKSATTSGDTTIGYQHTAVKEEAREGGRYNRAVRGYCNVRLPNGERCFGISLCFYNGFTIRFNRVTYYCKILTMTTLYRILKPSFSTVHMFALVVIYLFAVCFVCYHDEYLGYQLASIVPFVYMRHHKRHDLS